MCMQHIVRRWDSGFWYNARRGIKNARGGAQLKKSKPLNEASVSRRTVLASATFIPLAALTSVPPPAAAQTTASVFSAEQRRILEAFIDRIIPKDDLGPGAVEAGA